MLKICDNYKEANSEEQRRMKMPINMNIPKFNNNETMKPTNLNRTVIHEAGHAIAALKLKMGVDKITINVSDVEMFGLTIPKVKGMSKEDIENACLDRCFIKK